ncbi:cell division protein FtsQ/DivIB [Bacillus solimangrovi]|nr:FtsQ-type POTRA domain-containing protein [Bacillus solimangrovi]
MAKGKIVSIEDRIPKLKQQRKKRANRRFVFYITFFFVLIAIILYFQSPLSKVSSIEVSGNRFISTEQIISLSGLSTSDNFWKVEKGKVSTLIENHDEVKKAIVDKQFINSVKILIEEYQRTAYLLHEGQFHPILETGEVLAPLEDAYIPSGAPILMNWEPSEALQEMAAELRKVPPSIQNHISEIHHTPTESDPLHVTLYMNDGREVSVTIRDFAEKMTAYPAIASRLKPEQQGVIHLEVGAYFKSYQIEQDIEGETSDEDER